MIFSIPVSMALTNDSASRGLKKGVKSALDSCVRGLVPSLLASVSAWHAIGRICLAHSVRGGILWLRD